MQMTNMTRQIALMVVSALLISAVYSFAADIRVPEYVDMIRTDENDFPLSYPAFVFSEPITGEIYINQMLDLVIFSPDLFPLFTFGKRQGINGVWSVAIDVKGNTFVATGGVKDQPVPKIAVYNPAFRRQREILFPMPGRTEQYKPNRIAIDRSGNLYVLETYDNKVLICDLFGKQLDTLSAQEEGEPVPLVDIQIDANNRIYLLNERDSKIYVFDEQRKYLFKFGEKGGSSAKLSRPISIAVDAGLGLIYVNDYMRHTVNIYDYEGKYFSELGGMGWAEGWFQFPSRVAVDRSGRVFVADTFNSRIQVFTWKQKPVFQMDKKGPDEGEPKK